MSTESVQILIAMAIYMAAVIGIGIAFAKRANADSEKFFLGGRSLGPWVSAMSAEAADMRGWLPPKCGAMAFAASLPEKSIMP